MSEIMAEQLDSSPVGLAEIDLSRPEEGWSPLQTASLVILLVLCAILVWNAYNPQDIHIADLEYATLKADQNVPQKDISILGQTIQIGDQFYGRGLSMFGNSEISLRIPAGYAFFMAEIGIDKNAPEESGSVIFMVISDGAILYESPVIRKNMPPILISVPVEHRKTLSLRVSNAGDGNSGDYANWANARFVYSM